MFDFALFYSLSQAIAQLYASFDDQLGMAAEDETRFSLEVEPALTDLEALTAAFAPYTDFVHLNLEFQIHQAKGSAHLGNACQLVMESWQIDEDLNLPALSGAGDARLNALDDRLATQGASISVPVFVAETGALKAEGAQTGCTLRLFLNKAEAITRLAPAANVRLLLFVLNSKFLKLVQNFDLIKVSTLLVPDSQDTIVLLCGDLHGAARGPNLRILGRDQWDQPADVAFSAAPTDRQKIQAARRFQGDESSWQGPAPTLTPFHLRIDEADLDPPALLSWISGLHNLLCAASLANRCRPIPAGGLACDVLGYKRVEIDTPPKIPGAPAAGLYALYEWAYESSSSDKLEIVRQLLTLQLGLDPLANYPALLDSAGDILRIARGNYNVYLRRSVELYFDKRLRVSEFLQKFAEAISKSVAELTANLVGDLYKTLGVIVGAVITIVIDPRYTAQVVAIVAFLYLVYILFILIYLLPSVGWRYRDNVLEYDKNVAQLADILTPDEIADIEKDSFKRARVMFRTTFFVTYLVYVALAILAFAVFVTGLVNL